MRRARLSKRLLRNILACYHRASDMDRREGLYWYETAHSDAQALADRYGVTVWQAAGVIAALSPGARWGSNLLDADLLMASWRAGKALPAVGVYGARNVAKAGRILHGPGDGASVLLQFNKKTGPKTWVFYQLIAEPLDSSLVCIDRHAKAIAVNRSAADSDIVRPSEYEHLADHYRHIAELVGLLPHQVQAITWVTWRRLDKNLAQTDLPF